VSIHYFRFTLHDTGDRHRSHLLEALLARADDCREVADWRADAFRILAPKTSAVPGVGAAALFTQCGAPMDGTLMHGTPPMGGAVFMATPVHYVAEMSNVRLPADGVISLERPEAAQLAADFNRVWGDAGLRLALGHRADLFCVIDRSPAATTRDPVEVLGRHIGDYLPTGEGAPRLRQLMSEIEMWLFEHELNRSRAAAAAPVINGLWLWGGGAALTSLPRIEGWTAGDDPLFSAWADDAGPRPSSQATSGVVVVAAQPGTPAWRDMELNWLQPALKALRSGRIERLDLSAGYRCCSVSAAWRWRFWRRRRPWWESFT
jgi:hypothetical protein